MKILTRYLLRSYLPSFLLCLGIFLFVLLMNYFLRLFNLAVMKGISLGWILFCFSRLLPFFLSLALPMAFLVGLLITLGTFSESGELMAMRSSGLSFREILGPFLAIAIALSLLLFYVNHKASPEAFHSFRESYSRAASTVSRAGLEPRTMTRLNDWQIYVDTVSPEDGGLGGIRLIMAKGAYRRLRVTAPKGRLTVDKGKGIRLELENGTLIWPNDDPKSRLSATFGRYRLFMPFVDYRKVHRDPDLQELSTAKVREQLAGDKLDLHHRREYATEAALRSAGAAAPFTLFWAAAPLGLRLQRRSRAVGFALSLALLFVFYGLMALGIGLGRSSLAWSPWGPWLPNAAALAAGAVLWWRMLRK